MYTLQVFYSHIDGWMWSVRLDGIEIASESAYNHEEAQEAGRAWMRQHTNGDYQ